MYRNLYNKLIRLSKKSYFDCKLSEAQKDPKSIWKNLNKSMNRKSSQSADINEIKINEASVLQMVLTHSFLLMRTKLEKIFPLLLSLVINYMLGFANYELNFGNILVIFW